MAKRVVPGLPVMMVLGNVLREQAKRTQAQPAPPARAAAAAATSRAA